MYKVSIIVLLFIVNLTAQTYSFSAGYGYSEYSSKNSKRTNSLLFEVNRNWDIYKNLTFSAGLSITTNEIYERDVIIAPLYVGDPVKIYNSDLSIKINYIEIPIRLGVPLQIYKEVKVKPFLGLSISFATKTKKNIIPKKILFEGRPSDSGLFFDHDILEEAEERDFHFNINTQIGMEIIYKYYSIGLLIRRFPSRKSLSTLTDFESLYSYNLFIRFSI